MEKSRLASVGPDKRCFVTVGATAPFNALVKAVLAPAFIEALTSSGYNELRIQYGDKTGKETFDRHHAAHAANSHHVKIDITGFDFKNSGLKDELLAVKGSSPPNEGLIISHAGSGSVLDALRIGVPIIVVPNTDLLHNHQVELAEALAEQEYVIHGRVDDLVSAVREAEVLRKRNKQWPPLRSGEEKYKGGIRDVMYEEMGWQID
jgi:beta-1,4-N-acetylglucosaminyltransferase